MSLKVDQKGASAGRDLIGRDKYENHYHSGPTPTGIVDQLLKKLQDEVANNVHVRDTVEVLAHFRSKRAHDGIHGLEAKLKVAGREDELLAAIEKKELFAKLLDRWSLYASAQEIFAYLLAKAEHEFTYVIHPQLDGLSKVEVNKLVRDTIIVPVVQECGSSVFVINHSTAMGMVYWLAEQCFVRWHA
jgi:hypothetical protein